MQGLLFSSKNGKPVDEKWITQTVALKGKLDETFLKEMRKDSIEFYYGKFKNDMREDPEGHFSWANGDEFLGKFEKGMRKSGKYTFAPGAVWKEYEGEFSDKVQFEGRGN